MIDPSPHDRKTGADVLARSGFEVISAPTVDDAISLAARHEPQLILLDGTLAGERVLEDLARATVRSPSILFTFHEGLGAHLMRRLEVSAKEVNVEAVGFVEKPFQADILISTVESAVDGQRLDSTQRIYTREDEDNDTQVQRMDSPLYRALGLEPHEAAVEFQRDPDRDFDPRTMEPELPSAAPRQNSNSPAAEAAAAKRAHALAERICALIPERYPLHPAQMCAIASACEEVMREENTSPATARETNIVAEGSLGGVPPFQVLQLAENLGGTVMCRFRHDDVTIEVWLDDRQVIWARDRSRFEETEQLVYEVLTWTDGRFAVLMNATVPPAGDGARVAVPLAALLLEGLSRLDEWRRVGEHYSGTPQ